MLCYYTLLLIGFVTINFFTVNYDLQMMKENQSEENMKNDVKTKFTEEYFKNIGKYVYLSGITNQNT